MNRGAAPSDWDHPALGGGADWERLIDRHAIGYLGAVIFSPDPHAAARRLSLMAGNGAVLFFTTQQLLTGALWVPLQIAMLFGFFAITGLVCAYFALYPFSKPRADFLEIVAAVSFAGNAAAALTIVAMQYLR